MIAAWTLAAMAALLALPAADDDDGCWFCPPPAPYYTEAFDADSEWFSGPVLGGAEVTLDDGIYLLTLPDAESSVFITQPPIVDDLVFLADLDLAQCSGGVAGLFFRGVNFDSGYLLLLACDQSAWLMAAYDGGAVDILAVERLARDEGDPASVIRLGVVAQGGDFDVLLDGDTIATLRDDRYDAGLSGFYAQAGAESGTIFAFDNVEWWTVDEWEESQRDG